MLKFYETVVIVDAMIPDDAIASEFDAIEKRIIKKGKLHKIDKWGRRKLAYQIKGRSYGEYAVFYYDAGSDFPSELERGFRINENILRWLTVADNPVGIPENKPEEAAGVNAEGKPNNHSISNPDEKPAGPSQKKLEDAANQVNSETPEKEGKEQNV